MEHLCRQRTHQRKTERRSGRGRGGGGRGCAFQHGTLEVPKFYTVASYDEACEYFKFVNFNRRPTGRRKVYAVETASGGRAVVSDQERYCHAACILYTPHLSQMVAHNTVGRVAARFATLHYTSRHYTTRQCHCINHTILRCTTYCTKMQPR